MIGAHRCFISVAAPCWQRHRDSTAAAASAVIIERTHPSCYVRCMDKWATNRKHKIENEIIRVKRTKVHIITTDGTGTSRDTSSCLLSYCLRASNARCSNQVAIERSIEGRFKISSTQQLDEPLKNLSGGNKMIRGAQYIELLRFCSHFETTWPFRFHWKLRAEALAPTPVVLEG